MQSLELRAMGSRIFVALDHDGEAATRALGEVEPFLEAHEACASRFRTDSELSQLNAKAGRACVVSRALWDEIDAALDAARWSGGLVTPTVLAALERSGYDRPFDVLLGDAPANPVDEAPLEPVPSFRAITRSRERLEVQLPHGVRLDLGGTAKGRAADQAALRLGRVAPALMDAGGDVSVSGPRADGTPWPVGVSNPTRPDEALELVALAHGGIATSGRDFRRWSQAGVERHHIVDPRTGQPAESDVMTATVVASSAFRAEVAAKFLLIAGSRAGLLWLEAEPDLAAFLVLADGAVLESSRFDRYRWRE